MPNFDSFEDKAPFICKYSRILYLIRLLDIPAIREADNEVFIKFSLKLVWFERRATYHNLKEKVSQNTLENDDVKTIWIPKLIYENNSC